jgi:hypothetical protein
MPRLAHGNAVEGSRFKRGLWGLVIRYRPAGDPLQSDHRGEGWNPLSDILNLSRASTVIKATALTAVGVAVCAMVPTAVAVADTPNLVGSWSGHRERIASTEGYRNGDATLVITDQVGWTFKGSMTWTTPQGDMSDPLVGAFTPDGTLISGADGEGTYTFALVDAVTLDYCYAEHGDGFRTTCARLQKQG